MHFAYAAKRALIFFMVCFRVTVHVYYDDNLYNRFNSNTTHIGTIIKGIFSMVKTIYSQRDSLTTIMVPKIVNIEHKHGDTWVATASDLR